MPAQEPQGEKRRLRLEMRRLLEQASLASASEAGRAVAERVARLEAWRPAHRIGLFVSRSDEIDTAPLLDRVRAAGKGLFLPRMAAGRLLEFAMVDALDRLEVGPHGILEPSRACPPILPCATDLICVPGLAFDRAGGRLGRGGGYYDRSLPTNRGDPGRPRLVGIGFSFQLVERVPMTERDLRLDSVVTERETIESIDGQAGGAHEV